MDWEIERMLSNKITEFLTRKSFRRIKDLYDIFAISEVFDFESGKILECMHKRGLPIEWENIPFTSEVLTQLEHAWDKLTIVSRDDPSRVLAVKKPEFDDAVSQFNYIAFLLKELDTGKQTGNWIFKHGSVWEREEGV